MNINHVPDEYLNEFVDECNNRLNQLKLNINSKLTGTKYSLEEKWQLLSTLDSALLPSSKWLIHYPELEKHGLEYYDDFYKDRYALVDVVELYNIIQEAKEDEEDKYTDFDLEQFKKEIIEKGVRTFTNDW